MVCPIVLRYNFERVYNSLAKNYLENAINTEAKGIDIQAKVSFVNKEWTKFET